MSKYNLNAYYYSFEETGCDPVDNILQAVASAGKGYHNTDCWMDCDVDGVSVVDIIQRTAIDSAKQFNTRTSPWISIKDELPEDGAECFIYWRYDDGCDPEVMTGKFIGDYWKVSPVQRAFVKHDEEPEGVTHWMKISELPKETK